MENKDGQQRMDNNSRELNSCGKQRMENKNGKQKTTLPIYK